MTSAGTGNASSDLAQARERASDSVTLRILFMGVIAQFAGGKELMLDFGRGRTLRELLYELERRYGEEFGARIFRSTTPPRRLQMGMRIFINRKLIDEAALEQPLAFESESSPEILIYFLPAACGG